MMASQPKKSDGKGGQAAARRGRRRSVGRRSQTRRVFVCWLYAQDVNDGESCDTDWICRSVGLGKDAIEISFLDKLKEKYLEKQEVIDKSLSNFLKKEYPTIDKMCATILKAMLVDRALEPEMPIAVAIDEAIENAKEFAKDGYKLVNALAEKLWSQPFIPRITGVDSEGS